MKIRNILILAISLTMILACQEKESFKDQAVTEFILQNAYPLIPFAYVVEGRLVFENKEKFDEAIDILFNNQDKLDGFEKQFPGFVSARMAFDNLIDQLEIDYWGRDGLKDDISDLLESKDYVHFVEDDGEFYMEEVVHCSLLARILNENGIVQIGQSVFKYTHDETLEYDVLDLSMGQIILNQAVPKGSYENHIKTIDTHTKSGVIGVKTSYKDYDAGYRRVRARILETNSLLSGIKLGFSVTSYRRPCRGSLCAWYRRDVYELGLLANGKWSERDRDINVSYAWDYYGPNDFSVLVFKFNSSILEYYVYNLPYISGGGYELQVWFDNYHSTHHLRQNQNSSVIECYLKK